MRSSVATVSGPSRGDSDIKVARKHKPDYQILLFTGMLMMLGLIIMYAIGPQRAHVLNDTTGTNYTTIYFFMKQSVSLALALIAFAAAALTPYTLFRRYAKELLIVGLVLCVILAIAGVAGLSMIAQCANGACRWFSLGPLGSLQPAEFLKFGILLYLAGFLGMRAKQGLIDSVEKTLIPVGIIALLAVIFVIGIQKDMGTGLSVMAIIAVMVIMSGVRSRTLGIIGLLTIGLMVLMIIIAPHRIERVLTFFQGDTHTLDSGANYHITQAKIAIGTGGWGGLGIGNSVQATGYLPEAINDSVFAIMAEMFGFVGSALIILLFLGLLVRILRTIDYLEDIRLKLIAAGVFGWLASHVVLNIAAMIGIFPLTGITLPLLSFGGTSMIFIAAALGLVFQLSRYTNFTMKTGGDDYENSRSRRGVGRSRHTGRRGITGA